MEQNGKKAFRTAGNIMLILTLVLFVLLTGGAVAAGWLMHADHYGAAFRYMAVLYWICAAGMLIAAVLYFCKKDIAAAFLGLISYLPMPLMLLYATDTADRMGWYRTLDAQGFGSASAAFRAGMMWNFIPLILLLLLSLTRHFGGSDHTARNDGSSDPQTSTLFAQEPEKDLPDEQR